MFQKNRIYPNIPHHVGNQMKYVTQKKNRVPGIKSVFFLNPEPDFCDPVKISGTLPFKTFWKFNFKWKNGITSQNQSRG